MHCQKTLEIAKATGNDLIVQVKGNRLGLLQRCEHVAATAAPITTADSRDLARNRQEDRHVEVYAPGGALSDGEWGTLIAAIVRVTRSTLIRSGATGMWKRREQTAFYASSVLLPAETFDKPSAAIGPWRTRTIGFET